MIDDRTGTYRDRHRMTEAEIIASMCHSSPIAGNRWKDQIDAYKSGRAFSGHVKDAHKGIEDPNCNACKEIKARCGL